MIKQTFKKIIGYFKREQLDSEKEISLSFQMIGPNEAIIIESLDKSFIGTKLKVSRYFDYYGSGEIFIIEGLKKNDYVKKIS